MFKDHFGSCRDILGHEGIFGVMKFLYCKAILCHEWQFLVIKGHYVKDLCKGPRVVQHDIYSCNIPMGSVLRSVGAFKGNIWSVAPFIPGAKLY